MTDADARRRPIRVRSSGWVKAAAARLTRWGATPNAISLASIAFAVVGGLALWLAGGMNEGRVALYFVAVAAIYGRLLCNLFDGMVAVEGGKGSPAGELFNEVPDRVADVLFLVGAGAATGASHGAALGAIAALGAVMTAYARALGSGLGLVADFGGPMAKPHRMHALAGMLVLAALAARWSFDATVILLGIAAIAALTWLTVWLRLKRAYAALMSRRIS